MEKSTPSRTERVGRTRRERGAKAVSEVRRGLILEAAREAFAELGLAGASLREIARRAGYTPGALYSYFDSKEAIYGALLGESLERLNRCVAEALTDGTPPLETLRAAATAFYGFYRDQPQELDLGFYLFNGVRPTGLTPAWNDRLNRRLRDALAPIEQALIAAGRSPADATRATTALFAQIVGLLILRHSGRIRMFGQHADALLADHLDSVVAGLPIQR
ncbi:MAG: TetR/AcrR family transcriptional regulator [Rhodocyclaceae bacterium]|nr:TetR/AcrR family transcriptional regulator [Rhodocyclaceae bacterium]